MDGNYEPHGGCKVVMQDRSPEVLISGPSGTGKSMACLFKLAMIADNCPGSRTLIVRKTRASCTESVLVTLENQVLPPNCSALQGAARENRHVYRFPNKSEIVVGGMDNPDRIMSTEYDVIYAAEATELSEEDWEKLSTRLGRLHKVKYQQMLGDCNPSAPSHWLKQRCDRGDCRMIESRHEDNPLLYERRVNEWTSIGTSYLARLDNLTGARKERLRYGRWVAAEGVVYEDWDTSIHLIDKLRIPPDWRLIRAIDFGYQNPFVCAWIAIDHDGRMYVYRYTYYTKRLVEDHAREIVALTGREPIEATIADHDAEDNATLKRHGVPTRLARKEIQLGIKAVAARLRVAGDGRPRLFIVRDALVERDDDLVESGRPWTIEQEFDLYAWPKASSGRAMKEVPVDKDNHGMDILRYAVRYVDGIGSPSTGGDRLGTLHTASRRSLMRAV